MGVGNYTSQKVKPVEHLQKQVFIGQVGKNPTCIGRTKGNTIRRGANTIANQKIYKYVQVRGGMSKSLAVADSETVIRGEV